MVRVGLIDSNPVLKNYDLTKIKKQNKTNGLLFLFVICISFCFTILILCFKNDFNHEKIFLALFFYFISYMTSFFIVGSIKFNLNSEQLKLN